jgi:hypothetical protein
MVYEKIRFPLYLAAIAAAIMVGTLTWSRAHAASEPMYSDTLQQTTPLTDTMPMHQGDAHAGHVMPQQADAPGGMGAMMAHMARMQGMMAQMQRMMAGGMMESGTPMTDTMPMAGMMQGDMGEMMAEMQGMMAEMQQMMAGEMMAGGMHMNGQQQRQRMQGQPMQGGMMGQMPMMGTMIFVVPMPISGMMHQMPGMTMQGMDMGGMMMQGMDMGNRSGMGGMTGQGANQGAAPTPTAKGDVQSGALGAIEVKVTPPDLSNIQGSTIDFTVDLNATGVDLSFDLAELAQLSIAGHAMPATAWEVVYDHGHHVNGVLKFPAHMTGPIESAELTIADPEDRESLTLTWSPAQ